MTRARVAEKKHHEDSEEVGLLHDAQELLLVDLTVAIAVGLVNHLLELLVRHPLPSSLATRFKFLKLIFPVSSSSKRRKALRVSSFGSRFRIFCDIIVMNSGNSMVPEPSSSTSWIN